MAVYKGTNLIATGKDSSFSTLTVTGTATVGTENATTVNATTVNASKLCATTLLKLPTTANSTNGAIWLSL